MYEEKMMAQTDKQRVVDVVNRIDVGSRFTIGQLYDDPEFMVQRRTVQSYIRDLRTMGFIETTRRGGGNIESIYTLLQVIPDQVCFPIRKRKESSNGECPIPKLEQISDDLEHAAWVIREYVPFLERELAESKEREASLMQQLNHWAGVFRGAKVIHQRSLKEEDCD
jgi:hypothetical protein